MGLDCGSQIVICDLPIRFDTYKGCSHACKYCFVKRKNDIRDISKDNCIESLKKFIDGKRTKETNWCDWAIPLHWGGVSDPFQPVEERYRISYKALELLAETKYPFVVSTKGRLIAAPEYVELLKKCNCVVQISAASSMYDAIEPGAPKFEERLKMIKTVAPAVKRVIVRIQPYLVAAHSDIVKNLERFKDAGVYGVTVEGMKFVTKQKGLVKVAGDYCYPEKLLRLRFQEIKTRCHELGLAFFCAENRLRDMGDAMCCCGIDGLGGFKGNDYNLEHIYNGKSVAPTERMKAPKTGACFAAMFQSASGSRLARNNSFADMMDEQIGKKAYISACGKDG